MYLTTTEEDRLTIFVAAELAVRPIAEVPLSRRYLLA
jgi:hypothetical protein